MASTKVTFVTGTAEVRRRDPYPPAQKSHIAQSQPLLMTTEPSRPCQVSYVDGKCTCCPYGYHIDLDFLNFCRELESGSTLRNLKRIQRTKRKLRKSMEIMLDEQDGIAAGPMSAPPDVVHSTEAGRLMHMVNYERSATHRLLSHIDHSVAGSGPNPGRMPVDGGRYMSTSDSDDAGYSPLSPPQVRDHHLYADEATSNATFPSFTSGRTDSMSSLSSVSTVSSEAAMMHQAQFYQQQQQWNQHAVTQRTTTKVIENPVIEMGTAEIKHYNTSSSAQLMDEPEKKPVPPPPPPRSSSSDLHSVREAMSVSLHRLRELEEQVKTIPILQVRISVLKEEKRLLNLQLKAAKTTKTEEHTSPRHPKTPPPTLPKPVRTVSVGVGDHSVIEPYNIQPHLPTGFTIRENETHTQIYSSETRTTSFIHHPPPTLNLSFRQSRNSESSSLRESRLSSSQQDSPVFTINQIQRTMPKPMTRSVGVGEGNIHDAGSGLHVHEKEFRTVLMNQGGGVAKRNVGIDCRVPTRDVGVLFQCDEEKPETRTVGVNVNYDTRDIITSLDFRGETELRMALMGVLQRNVRSIGTNCNFRPEKIDVGVHTEIFSGVTAGTGDETMRTDVEIRPVVARRSFGVNARAESSTKSVSTDKDWQMDAATNTQQVDRIHRAVMTERQRQQFAATNTEPVVSRGSANQTELKMFVAMDAVRNSTTNTEKIPVYSVPTNTEQVRTFTAAVNTDGKRTFNVGSNTTEQVADLFRKQETEQQTTTTITETTFQQMMKERRPLMVDRGVGDGLIEEEERKDEEQYSFSETTEVITRPRVLSVQEQIVQRGASQASAFMTKSHEVSAVSDTTDNKSEVHVKQGDLHYTGYERSRRSAAASNTQEKTKSSPDEALFQETIVEHFIITKDGKKLISEEKTTRSAAGSNHSFKKFSEGNQLTGSESSSSAGSSISSSSRVSGGPDSGDYGSKSSSSFYQTSSSSGDASSRTGSSITSSSRVGGDNDAVDYGSKSSSSLYQSSTSGDAASKTSYKTTSSATSNGFGYSEGDSHAVTGSQSGKGGSSSLSSSSSSKSTSFTSSGRIDLGSNIGNSNEGGESKVSTNVVVDKTSPDVGSKDVNASSSSSTTESFYAKSDKIDTLTVQDNAATVSTSDETSMVDKSSPTVVTNPYRTVENLSMAMSAYETSGPSLDISRSKSRQVSKTSSETNLSKVQKKSDHRLSLKNMDTIFDMRRTGSVEDFMPDAIRKYMSIDPSNSKDSGFGEDLLQRFSEQSGSTSSSSLSAEKGMPYTVKVSKTVTTRRSTKSGDKVSVQETKTVKGEDGKVITTVTETDKDGNTVTRKADDQLSGEAVTSFTEGEELRDSKFQSSTSSASYSESLIKTSTSSPSLSTDKEDGSAESEHSYGSLDRRTGQLKSILKQSKSETDQLNERRGITFAETVKGGTGSSSEEGVNSSDSDDSAGSYEEGSYDSQQGQVIYSCEDDEAIAQGMPGAHMFDQNIRETYELSQEVSDACQVLATYLQDSTTIQTKQLNASQATVQQEWFQVSSLKLSSDHQVEDFLSSVNEISKRLLEYIINMTDNNGNTAIHYCVSHCNFHIASLLLDSEVCAIDRQNKAGYTPLMLAGLAQTSNLGQLEVIKRIFAVGDVNARAAVTQQTALMLSASHGRTQMVQLLVEAGADLNAQDVDGSTALMCACEHGHIEIVNFLLAQPDINASIEDNEHSTALTVAMEAGHKDVGVILYRHLNFSKPPHSPGPHKKRKGSSSPTPSLRLRLAHLRHAMRFRSIHETTL